MSVGSEINRVKYVAEDFSTYRQEADEFFQTNYPDDFNNLLNTDLGNALMDQLAWAMQMLSFMINRRSSELFLTTARLNSSIVKLARMLGYPIKPASPSTSDLTITLTDGPYTFPVVFDVGFQWQGPGDTIYEYRGAIPFVIPAGQTTAVMPIKEGQTRTLAFTSDGEPDQFFNIFGITSGQFLYSDSMTVNVDGALWDRLDMIKYENLNTYEVFFADDPPKLKFGDGIAGNIPALDSQINIQFVYGKGADGVIGEDQISGPVNPIVIGGIPIEMEVSNTPANVGENPEDIRHVRAFASSFFRTQNAAVVKSDYDTISALETGVALADAQLIRGISGDITLTSYFDSLSAGSSLVSDATSLIQNAEVSGIQALGISGFGLLFVGGTSFLGVSGIDLIGTDVSGNVTGISSLGVSGIDQLAVSGESFLGITGISELGVSGLDTISQLSVSGTDIIEDSVSGLKAYLSQTLSDTSRSNHVQVILLSVDGNNKYIAPNLTTITNVKSKLDQLKDAVVTVYVVSGISRVVECDIEVELGISQGAVRSDVEAKSLDALVKTTNPFGLLVKRTASTSLYISDIIEAIDDANSESDVRFINAKITYPLNRLDADGNLIIKPQEIIQNRNVTVTAVKKFLNNGEVISI